MEQDRKPPKFESHPLMYCLWHLEHSYPIYQAFRDIADQWSQDTPHMPISADAICHKIRFDLRLQLDQDAYHISNNLVSFYGRVYRLERPEANVGTRSSWIDSMSTEDWDEVRDVLRRMKELHENL